MFGKDILGLKRHKKKSYWVERSSLSEKFDSTRGASTTKAFMNSLNITETLTLVELRNLKISGINTYI